MGDMNISPDGFAPASQSFSPKVVKLAAEHGYTGAIDRLSRKSEPRKRIKQHSAKWSKEQRAWNKLVKKRIEEVHGGCEVGFEPGCTGRATTGHHKLHRSQGGKAELSNCVVCCWPCHSYIETHPAWAVENGYTIKRSAVTA